MIGSAQALFAQLVVVLLSCPSIGAQTPEPISTPYDPEALMGAVVQLDWFGMSTDCSFPFVEMGGHIFQDQLTRLFGLETTPYQPMQRTRPASGQRWGLEKGLVEIPAGRFTADFLLDSTGGRMRGDHQKEPKTLYPGGPFSPTLGSQTLECHKSVPDKAGALDIQTTGLPTETILGFADVEGGCSSAGWEAAGDVQTLRGVGLAARRRRDARGRG